MTAAGSPSARVVVYGRAGCHLCADAEALVARLARESQLSCATVDIDSDPVLLALYDTTVPVVMLDGTEIGRAPLDADALRRKVSAAGR